MVVCKYYLEGYCKYGSRCKFDHASSYDRRYDAPSAAEYSSGERPSGTSILKGASSSFGNKEFNHSFNQNSQQTNYQQTVHVQPTSLGSKYSVQETMQIITKDIIQAEKGNQWQLSTYSPLKELTNIPGLDDHSPEELRWECYKAVQNGTLPLFQAIVQQLFANVTKINNELKKKDVGYSIIDRWLREGQSNYNSSITNTASLMVGSSVAPSGFPGAPHAYSAGDVQTARNNSFSFALPQEQTAGVMPYSAGTSVFGGNQTSNQTHQAFSSGPTEVIVVDSHAYSSVEELVDGELEAFKANSFVFGAIPTKPPLKELCNL